MIPPEAPESLMHVKMRAAMAMLSLSILKVDLRYRTGVEAVPGGRAGRSGRDDA